MELDPLTGLLEKQPTLLQTIQSWQRQKAQSVEAAKVTRWDTLHHFIEAEMAACEAFARTLPPHMGDSETLNQFFRKWNGYQKGVCAAGSGLLQTPLRRTGQQSQQRRSVLRTEALCRTAIPQ